MEGIYSSYQNTPARSLQPTSADYAWAEARSNAARPGDEPEVWERGLTLEEHIVVLQGQVSFLAELVSDLIDGGGWHTASELRTLEKIKEWGKE